MNMVALSARWIAVALLAWTAAHADSDSADVTDDDSVDCGAIVIPEDDGLLTRAERIALLDQALLDSLNTPCPVIEAAGGGGGGSVASDGVEGARIGEQGEQGTDAVASIPAGGIEGEESKSNDDDATDDSNRPNANKTNPYQRASDENNGAIPNDIPPAANDDIIAKQFRAAAIEETDPVVKAKLWNEYRRYKGLPTKPEPVPTNGTSEDDATEGGGTKTAEAESKP